MSLIRSLSVGEGDMFYIMHDADSFTIIDCSLTDDNREGILSELIQMSSDKGISRFISTHPDEDHFAGLEFLDSKMGIANFYCVKNEATKEDETPDFIKYRELRDSPKAYYLEKNCRRKWLNVGDDDRQSAGIQILWPVTTNPHYQEALDAAKEGDSPNNISAVIKYSYADGPTFLWMGDLETEFMEKVKGELSVPKVHVLFAPHHGRKTGTIPSELLESMEPDIIVIGEADSQHLDYYSGYHTITQNSAGDITFIADKHKCHVFVSEAGYSVDFLDDEKMSTLNYYIGTLNM
ncbi:MAG TPA: hypothetical protein VMH23_19715 [Bacteroidota bacterium]|nr:hypothetical protein [Bacteroidota bacterium]